MTDSNQHPTPRADVLAEEYRGKYLWAELDKARARIADLEEQLEAAQKALREIADTRLNTRSSELRGCHNARRHMMETARLALASSPASEPKAS